MIVANVPVCSKPARRYAARAGVVVGVDVERHRPGRSRAGRSRPPWPSRRCQALAAELRVDVHPLDLAGARRRTGHLGLEQHPPVLDPRERPAAPDELVDPGPVEVAAPVHLRADADLLGVHRHAGRVEGLRLLLGGTPHQRVPRDRGDLRRRQVWLVPPEVPRSWASAPRARPTAAPPRRADRRSSSCADRCGRRGRRRPRRLPARRSPARSWRRRGTSTRAGRRRSSPTSPRRANAGRAG